MVNQISPDVIGQDVWLVVGHARSGERSLVTETIRATRDLFGKVVLEHLPTGERREFSGEDAKSIFRSLTRETESGHERSFETYALRALRDRQ